MKAGMKRTLVLGVSVLCVAAGVATVVVRANATATQGLSNLTVKDARGAALALPAKSQAPRRLKKPVSAVATTPGLSASRVRQAIQGSIKPVGRPTQVAAPISDVQQRRLQVLNSATQADGGVEAHFDARSGTLTFLKPRGKPFAVNTRSIAPGTVAPPTIAQAFLGEYRDLLKLDDPQAETRIASSVTGVGGLTHVRLQQAFQGVPVWGKELLVHLDSSNGVYLVQGNSAPTPRGITTTPGITADAALTAVRVDLNADTDAAATTELVVYSPDHAPAALAYKIDITPAIDARWVYIVDAVGGKILHRYSNLHDAVVTASGTDLNGVNRSFRAWQQAASEFYLVDPETPTTDASYNPITNGPNAAGDTFILNSNADGSQLSYLTNTALNSGWQATAVSAAYNTRTVFDYYKTTHLRNSLDGNGKNLMVAIHFGTNLNNAFWNGTFMVYGDGDNVLFKPLAGCLDVAAHEMTHGVIENSANLIYENQSGALNESFADVFGAMVDRDDWLMGEDCTVASPGFLRSLLNPAQGVSGQPVKMSQYQNLPNSEQGDNGGVHINSGIPNRAAYLIAEGLTAEGLGTSIGRAKTEKIYYAALTNYLTASSQFIDARRATIQAATDLYGATEAQAVATAWDVVEVTDSGSGGSSAPTPTTAVTGDDMMVYLYSQTGNYTDLSLPFNVAVQTLDRPFSGYNSSTDFGPFNGVTGNVAAAYTRPAAYTDSSGTTLFFVGTDNNLYAADFSANVTPVTDTGDIYSIAISSDGSYFAYTSTDTADNTIHVVDVAKGTTTPIPVVPVDYQQGATGADTIFYADSLAFDYSGRVIVFDALNCISTPDSTCASGGGYQYWSIGFLDLTTGQLSFPIANQNPAIDLGYPQFAANNQFVITLDMHDSSNAPSIASRVVTIDLEKQTLQTAHDFGTGTAAVWGVPSFWGDDTYITYQEPDGTVGSIASRVALDASWAGTTTTSPTVNNSASGAAMPLMFRNGVRALTGALSASTSLLDFGSVSAGESKSLTLTLSNTGNSDVNILSTTLSGSAFASNAFNTRVPHGQSLVITLTFTPGSTSGTQTGALTFGTDGNPSALAISLSGTTPDTTAPADSKKSGGGGDLNNITLILMFMALTGVYLMRRRRVM